MVTIGHYARVFRSLALMVGLLSLALVSSCGSAATSAQKPVATADATTVAPQHTTVNGSTGATQSVPAFVASQFDTTAEPFEGPMQSVDEEITLTNTSDRLCTLSGYPTVAGVGSDGTSTPLNATLGDFHPALQSAATIAPGGAVQVIVGGTVTCDGGARQQLWNTLEIGLPSGTSVRVASASARSDGAFDSFCGTTVSIFGTRPA